jgi:plastocyanin
MNKPIAHLPPVLGAVIIAVAAAVTLPVTTIAAQSSAPDSPAALPAAHHDPHVVQAAGQIAGQVAGQVLAATATVDINDGSFSPKALTVAAGTTVTWTNRGSDPHTVTGAAFDSGRVNARGTFSFTFAIAGTFSYVCSFHSEMTGTVVVTGGAAVSARPTPSTPPPSGVRPSPTAPPAAGGTTITMSDNSYSPASLTVAAGTTVTWVNRGTAMHSVTTNDALFHSGLLSPGQSFSYTFGTPGRYPYLCAIHPAMIGTIVVTGVAATPTASASAPPALPAPPPAAAPANAPAAPASASSTTIVIGENNFTPGLTTVVAGTTVVWVNHGLVKHTVTSSGPTPFDSGTLSTDGRFSVNFGQPGRYPYSCEFHAGMSGVIEVLGVRSAPSAGSAPDPVAAPTSAPPIVALVPSDGAHVLITDNAFDAPKIVVSAGTTVNWMNHGQAKHTVTFSTGPNSDLLAAGQAFARRFDVPGTYPYVCALHPGMTGTIEVTAAAAIPAPALVAASGGPIAATTDQKAPPAGPSAILILLAIVLGCAMAIGIGGFFAVRGLAAE